MDELRSDWLFDFDDEIRRPDRRRILGEDRPHRSIVRIAKPRTFPSAALNEDSMATCDQLSRPRRGQRNAVLVRLQLLGNADSQSVANYRGSRGFYNLIGLTSRC